MIELLPYILKAILGSDKRTDPSITRDALRDTTGRILPPSGKYTPGRALPPLDTRDLIGRRVTPGRPAYKPVPMPPGTIAPPAPPPPKGTTRPDIPGSGQ